MAIAECEVLQEFISEHAWGTVRCRDGLDLKSRSLITVAFLVALGRAHELAGHLRGALNNGVSRRELQECGLPAILSSATIPFKLATVER